jgi:hypothetical protein
MASGKTSHGSIVDIKSSSRAIVILLIKNWEGNCYPPRGGHSWCGSLVEFRINHHNIGITCANNIVCVINEIIDMIVAFEPQMIILIMDHSNINIKALIMCQESRSRTKR